MHGLGKKASLLALLIVMATAFAGSAYTLWYEDLTLKATVTTTELDARIRCGSVTDNENQIWPSPPDLDPVNDAPHSLYPEGPKLGPGGTLKDVAVGPMSDRPDGDPHKWEIIVSNAYPGYAVDCEVEVKNTAPLPWHMENINVKVEECPLPLAPQDPCTEIVPGSPTWQTICQQVTFGDCNWGDMGINPPANHPGGLSNWSPIYVNLDNWEGCQIHQNIDLKGSAFIGVNQSAKENTQYVITLTYTVNQWNESAWSSCWTPKPL